MNERDEREQQQSILDRRHDLGLHTMGRKSSTKGWTPYRPQEGELPESWEEGAEGGGLLGLVVLGIGILAVVVLAWWLAGSI